jgi:hypothetical protein
MRCSANFPNTLHKPWLEFEPAIFCSWGRDDNVCSKQPGHLLIELLFNMMFVEPSGEGLPRGQCYEHSFLRFQQKTGLFLQTNVMILTFQKIAVLRKKRHLFRQIFLPKIFF